MKKLLLLFVGALLLVSCKKDPGSVSGNVYYKFNEFVGNKPDAGTTVKLYNLDKGAEPATYETTSDVQGNYKLENVVPGDYLLLVRSKTTTAENIEIYNQFAANSKELKELFGGDLDKLNKETEELAAIEKNKLEAYTNALSSHDQGDKYLNDYAKYLKEGTAKQKSISDKLPTALKSLVSAATGYDQKIELKKITVEEAKNVQNNTDFGVTYK
ncbi:carboxypeptidase-like regulatory domain-containing protein [Flavobacterium subsaxonicum]|uniref:Carboxypeptidase regulatory-like domain-containing protein n=1 Tax=Flavobacterium subsaxonicum WB 4.1-42 = DSM 21790 TaxID=1121898 RepID=A0A0A2MYH4_9FLAO|nr:carboxypeptidase-like regulatory domain-containing protein [Flavobacterium subsaxonicum]KGO93265.1 hypothetical protein Q766_08135 [Flavobacterium subsaxonicum WB 4.1-42 = DSM 21790]